MYAYSFPICLDGFNQRWAGGVGYVSLTQYGVVVLFLFHLTMGGSRLFSIEMRKTARGRGAITTTTPTLHNQK